MCRMFQKWQLSVALSQLIIFELEVSEYQTAAEIESRKTTLLPFLVAEPLGEI